VRVFIPQARSDARLFEYPDISMSSSNVVDYAIASTADVASVRAVFYHSSRLS